MRVFHAIVATGLIRVVLWIVLTIGSHRAAQAWVTILPGSFPSTRRTSRNPVLTKPLSMGAPREEFLEDCDADPEGECELDWDKMGFSEGGEDDSVLPSMEQELYDLVKGSHDEVIRKVSEIDPSQARVGLEMAWQMHAMQDECEVETPESCSEPCESCRGAGVVPCRFCHGTKVFSLVGLAAQSCRICEAQGVETCQACRGSGWIADWTQLGAQTTQPW